MQFGEETLASLLPTIKKAKHLGKILRFFCRESWSPSSPIDTPPLFLHQKEHRSDPVYRKKAIEKPQRSIAPAL